MVGQTSVGDCVSAIVASFANGSDVLRRVRERRRARQIGKKQAATAGTDCETRLVNSMQIAPQEISEEYRRDANALGHGFTIGDGIAQSNLAEILLRLNTGLIGIIASFLGPKARQDDNLQLDYRGLISLSEQSRIDTNRTLRDLSRRLLQLARVPRPVGAHRDGRHRPNVKRGGESKQRAHGQVKRPMIARVVIEDSSKSSQIAVVRPGEKQRKVNRHTASASASSPNLSTVASSLSKTSQPLPLAQTESALRKPVNDNRIQADTRLRQPEHPRKRSPRAKGENTTSRAAQSTPSLAPKPPVQPKVAASMVDLNAPAASRPPGQHKPQQASKTGRPLRPISYYSIAASARTKLGEIPSCDWAEPWDEKTMAVLNQEAMNAGWPIVPENGMLGPDKGQSKVRRLWDRFRRA